MTRPLLAVAASVVATLAFAACNPASGFCQAAADCDKFDARLEALDSVGTDDDSEAVCEADYAGRINVLRANSETACQKEADELVKFLQCANEKYAADKGSACNLMSITNDNPCQGELQNLFNAQQDAGDRCDENQT